MKDLQINLIVAYSRNRVIGKDNQLLWHLGDDMAFFKKMTTNKIVIMGRKTYESLPPKFRPLPNRTNIVLSLNAPIEEKENLIWIKNISELKNQLTRLGVREVFVIGGGQVYNMLLPFASRIYATEVNIVIEGDTYFPELESTEWSSEVIEQHIKDAKNEYDFSIRVYQRIGM